MRDSKKLSASQREALAPQIQQCALAWAIGIASVEEIDRINILQATFLAMQRATLALALTPSLCRIDGSQRPALEAEIEMVVGGDDSVEAIMAAAIVAKVARDAELVRLDALHAGYGLAQHKGYGTPLHLNALQQQGPSPIHRMSFAPCRAAAVNSLQ